CADDQKVREGMNAAMDDGHEAEQITGIRADSNYLTPQLGLFSADTWTVIALYVRNLVLNWTLFVPFFMGCLMLPRLCAAVLNCLHWGRFTALCPVLSSVTGEQSCEDAWFRYRTPAGRGGCSGRVELRGVRAVSQSGFMADRRPLPSHRAVSVGGFGRAADHRSNRRRRPQHLTPCRGRLGRSRLPAGVGVRSSGLAQAGRPE